MKNDESLKMEDFVKLMEFAKKISLTQSETGSTESINNKDIWKLITESKEKKD